MIAWSVTVETESNPIPVKLPITNVVRIDVENLEETLSLYETHRYGFLEKIPRLR